MHEWALAEAVVSTVSQIAIREGLRRVTEVRLKVGELQQIEIEILRFALSELKRSSLLEEAEFIIETEKAELRCRVCGHKWFFRRNEVDEDVAEAIHFVPEIAHAYIRCPRCGSPDFEVVRGRGVWLESVEGVK
ncbi:hydrogenase nickel incorporation protein HypA [Candidatus Bathyarchaeota archaeon]|nr:hydrogenase nickel incorporation protein HypA [Candidatus Bathyarchaeota archaeon]